MNNILIYLLAFALGVLLGAIFFGGLWYTVRRGITSPQPAIWFLVSMLLRMSIALCGFYFVSDGYWDRLLLCLLGFIAARLIVTWLTLASLNPVPLAQEVYHAPEPR